MSEKHAIRLYLCQRVSGIGLLVQGLSKVPIMHGNGNISTIFFSIFFLRCYLSTIASSDYRTLTHFLHGS